MSSLLDFIISFNLKNNDEIKYKIWDSLHKDSINADIIIMGSSRAWRQYNTHIIDSIQNVNSYNLGIDGSGFDRQILRYYTYERFNVKPNLIIQNIDFLSFKGTFGYQREQFFPYFIFDRKLISMYRNCEQFNVLELYIPCYRYIGYTKEIKKSFGLYGEAIDTLYKGYRPLNMKYNGKELREMKNISFKYSDKLKKEFEDYCAYVKSNNINLCFVYAPVYIEATRKISNLTEMYNVYQTIATKYDIPILDYNFHTISYDSTNFYNATHLNKKGSILFSTELAHDLDSLGIFNVDKITYTKDHNIPN